MLTTKPLYRRFAHGLAVLLLSSLLVSCDSVNQQEAFAEAANRAPEGFVQTNEGGEVISEDEDDWRTSPFFRGRIRIEPAYPNPSSGSFVTIPITILDFNAFRGSLVLRGFNTSNRFILLDEIPNASDPGVYVFNFSTTLFGAKGLQRVFIFDTLGELISYGDIMVE